jgi:cyclopropane fatty-acyl-phospholipid synthase-like methyltransferase
VSSRVPVSEIVAYYEPKTLDLLRRYGPGPRLHYHTGIVDEPGAFDISIPELCKSIVVAQERMLRHAAEVWHAKSNLCGEVVDVGCGLGGGAIFWAQEFGAQVTAVTCVPSHVAWVSRFANQADVASRVRPLLCDAVEIPGEDCFDAAVAIDSICHMPRRELFLRLARLLRPGGRVFVTDCFLVRPEYEELFNRHWHVRIGTIEEYRSAAQAADLREDFVEEIAPRVEHFWSMTLALIQAEKRENKTTSAGGVKFAEAVLAHADVRRGLRDGGYRYALMSFVKDHNTSDPRRNSA